MKEKSIVNLILKNLKAMPNCVAIKTHGSIYSSAGTPDILGCHQGRSFALEVKCPGKHATPIQQHVLNEWGQAGAIARVVRSWDEVKTYLLENL